MCFELIMCERPRHPYERHGLPMLWKLPVCSEHRQAHALHRQCNHQGPCVLTSNHARCARRCNSDVAPPNVARYRPPSLSQMCFCYSSTNDRCHSITTSPGTCSSRRCCPLHSSRVRSARFIFGARSASARQSGRARNSTTRSLSQAATL